MKIVVGVDGRGQAMDAIALTDVLSAAWDAEVVIATVYPWDWGGPRWGLPFEQAAREDAEAILARAAGRLARPHELRLVASTSTAAGLHGIVEQEAADLLVLGSSHRGRVGRVLLGEVTGRVVHGLPCALAVAPRGYAERPQHELDRVGVAYDASPEAQAALRWSEALAQRVGATLTLYRVLQFPHIAYTDAGVAVDEAALFDDLGRRQKQELEDALAQVPVSLGPHIEVLEGSPASTLAAAAENDDLFVTGSRGYGRIGSVLLGSTSHGLLHHARCPLIVLPRSAERSADRPAIATQA